MDKRDIIEGLARKIHINERIWVKIYKTEDSHSCKWEELSEYHRELYLAGADILISYLHRQGVVIKVDRELPKNPIKITDLLGLTTEEATIRQLESDCFHEVIQDTMLKAGYVAVKPLVEDAWDYITRNAYPAENIEPLIEE